MASVARQVAPRMAPRARAERRKFEWLDESTYSTGMERDPEWTGSPPYREQGVRRRKSTCTRRAQPVSALQSRLLFTSRAGQYGGSRTAHGPAAGRAALVRRSMLLSVSPPHSNRARPWMMRPKRPLSMACAASAARRLRWGCGGGCYRRKSDLHWRTGQSK